MSLFKKEVTDDKTKYRPISILLVLFKVFKVEAGLGMYKHYTYLFDNSK